MDENEGGDERTVGREEVKEGEEGAQRGSDRASRIRMCSHMHTHMMHMHLEIRLRCFC
jgi:hypothetical protein